MRQPLQTLVRPATARLLQVGMALASVNWESDLRSQWAGGQRRIRGAAWGGDLRKCVELRMLRQNEAFESNVSVPARPEVWPTAVFSQG